MFIPDPVRNPVNASANSLPILMGVAFARTQAKPLSPSHSEIA